MKDALHKTAKARLIRLDKNSENAMIQAPHLDLAAWLRENNCEANGSLPLREIQPARLTTDTRKLQDGSVFIPLRGESFDGHTFIPQAFEHGAVIAFCSRQYFQNNHEVLKDLPLILCDNTLFAYQGLAQAWHRQLNIPVIAITGSSGKTSSKEILAQVLEPFFKVHRTALNYNNEIGVPKTLLELTAEHELCLIEMGMRGLGQIDELCQIAEPQYGLITNIGPVHLSELGSMENIAKAKWELAVWLQTNKGTLSINNNNSWLHQLGASFQGQDAHLLRCGTGPLNDLQLIELIPEVGGQTLRYRIGDDQAKSVWLDLEGEHQALNLLCCLGLLKALGKQLSDGHRLNIPKLFGRQQRQTLAGRVFINDAYNANPDSMKAALGVLASQPKRRIAVLGKMAELGPQADNYHRDIGVICEELGLDAVYVVGSDAETLVSSIQKVPGYYFADKLSLIKTLKKDLQPGDTILFKASRSASLEEVVEPLAQYFTALAQ